MDKAFEVQKQVRDNVKTFQTYLTDLQTWETEMKRKEAALNGAFEQDLPPVRSKLRKDKPVTSTKKTPQNRISSFDYKSWDNFDADKACEEIDMADMGPVSLDSKKSSKAKLEKLREEAQYEKERGNNYVKEKKWDEAISCYSRAIELVKDDAIYYANRGLCYLKKDSLHQAEKDCTEALQIDPTYVKALQRRATARERLGSLRGASQDLHEVLKLEPHNNEAKKQLDAIKARMGTKGTKSKSSPCSTPTMENKPFNVTSKPNVQPKIVEIVDDPVKLPVPEDKWKDGVGESVTVIKPVKKPPHMRSKRPLKRIAIQEIELGIVPQKPSTRLKIIELEENDHGDSNNNDANKIIGTQVKNNGAKQILNNTNAKGDMNSASPESIKLITDSKVNEKDCIERLVAPVSSVQFMTEWKRLEGETDARSHYLSIIEPSKIPSIFANALESDVLSGVLSVLHDRRDKFKRTSVAAYLRAMCGVKRFSALAMFLSAADKEKISNLLEYCKTAENVSETEIADLKNKYEI